MLKYLKLDDLLKYWKSYFKTLTDGCKTADLGGNATTTEFTDKISPYKFIVTITLNLSGFVTSCTWG